MSIAPGTNVGPYEIVAVLGAGGMGEVYRARDTRLDRFIAVKVLSPRLAVTPDLLERFRREARAVAALNHPNICTICDIGAGGGDSQRLAIARGRASTDIVLFSDFRSN